MPAKPQPRYEFKMAETADERLEVYRLLYQTFVLEIPRYTDPGNGILVDRFDERNIYFVAMHDDCVCGTMAIHDGPDFSVTKSLANPGLLLQLRKPLIEARIFAVRPNYRFGLVFAGLACSVHRYARSNGYANILISGLARRKGMYEKMGFRSLGPATLRGGDHFVPMTLDLTAVPTKVEKNLTRWGELL